MPIINNNSIPKEKIKLEINANTLQQIQAYCKWAGIENLSYFFEEAVHFVFAKDTEWKRLKKLKNTLK